MILALLMLVPAFVGEFWAYQLGLYFLYALAAMGVGLTWGQAGILPLGVDIRPPQLEPLAHAYGLAYRRVASAAELGHALQEYRSARRPLIIDVDARPFE